MAGETWLAGLAGAIAMPAAVTGSLPGTLSGTGVFSTTSSLTVKPGVIPYDMINPLSHYATSYSCGGTYPGWNCDPEMPALVDRSPETMRRLRSATTSGSTTPRRRGRKPRRPRPTRC